MGIEDIFTWYQQKIGTYDKQQWETRLEQREQRNLYGFKHVQMRSTKPNTELIDLDLVRGSSFTKAKPQHGFITVAKLATFRLILLPLYAKWWTQQSSRTAFILIFILYLAQIVNCLVYFINTPSTRTTEIISCMELVVPSLIMWVLSLIHSQIVATNPGTELKNSGLKSRHYRSRRSHLRQQVRRLEKKETARKMRDKTEKKAISPGRNKKLQFDNDVEDIDEEILLRPNRTNANLRINHGIAVEDDGFESLNGNGSRTSEEETGQKTPPNNIRDKSKYLVGSDSQKSVMDESKKIEETNSQRSSEWMDEVHEDKDTLGKLQETKKHWSTDSETEGEASFNTSFKKQILGKRRNSHIPIINITSTVDSTCDTEDEVLSSPEARKSCPILLGDVTSSATEWMGVTTNSEDYSSDDVSETQIDNNHDFDMLFDNDLAPTAILNPPSVKVSCIIWERNEIKKANLTMLDITSAIIGKVESMSVTIDYFYLGIIISTVLALLPLICRFFNFNSEGIESEKMCNNISVIFTYDSDWSMWGAYNKLFYEYPILFKNIIDITFGLSVWERTFVFLATCQRWILASMVFFLLSVAERTFKQRLLYAKLFSHLTSSRRARKSELPHFRLNKVRNIKTWLSVRSYLKKRGPQRSVDVIVSTAFIISLLLLTFLCVELLKETVSFSQYYLEALIWCLGLGFMILRFMTLGTKINKKYRNLSVLITEQINLHLQIEQKPHKKEELTVANNVLKLAIDLLKELENPFKISGLSANPILYNVTKLVILSALSGVLSEMLGFKLKLHKIKLK